MEGSAVDCEKDVRNFSHNACMQSNDGEVYYSTNNCSGGEAAILSPSCARRPETQQPHMRASGCRLLDNLSANEPASLKKVVGLFIPRVNGCRAVNDG